MKKIINYFIAIALGAIAVSGCTKVDDLPLYANGVTPVVTVSKNAVTASLADSNTSVLTIDWTSPMYANDSSTSKYIIQIDSAGRNFTNPASREVTGKLTTSFTGNELNSILLNFGFSAGNPYKLDVRVISSYGNNNERHNSNLVNVNVTAFSEPSTLTSTAAAVSGAASTASQNALTLNWTKSFKSYSGIVNYTIEYDSAGKNFISPQVISAGNSVLTKPLTQEEVNSTALTSGIAIGSSGKVEYRVKGTTAGGAIVYSNVVNIMITTFSPVPASLYIVGDATPGGWSNPVPTPSQLFTKVDAYSFSITIGLTAGKSYLFLPVNGSWDHKYGGSADGTSAGGANLLKDDAVPGSNTPAPAVSGVYKIVVNFQTNKVTVTQIAVPANLFIVGDATAGGWDNPVPVPSQKFTQISNTSFGIVTNLTAGKSYLFLPVNGSWDHKYGGASNGTTSGGGALLADDAVPGSNTPAPSVSGLYKIVVDFATNSYTVTPYSGPSDLYIVGDATPGGWSNPVLVPSQQFTKVNMAEYQITIGLSAGKSYLLLPVNGSWDHKYGGSSDGTASGGGTLLADGDIPGSNTPAPSVSGNYKIVVNFISNTYKVTPQ